jgi:protein TonB
VKRSVVVSSVVHATFLVLVISPGFQSRRNHIVEVINVSLVGEQKQAKPEAKIVKPPEPAPQPVKKTEEPKMAYKAKTKTRETKEEVKPVQDKPKQQAPTKTEAPPQAAKQTTEADRALAAAGAASNVRVDEEDFKFAYYLEIIREKVSFNWSPPPLSGGRNVMCTVYFKVMRDGRVSDVKVEQPSSFDLFDKSALRAVNLSGPLPPLPAGFAGRWLGVHFEFQQTSG